MKKIYLILIAIFIIQNNLKAQNLKILTLNDCISTALDKATAVLKGDNNIAVAGNQVLAAYSQFLPNLVAGVGYNFDRGNHFYPSTGPFIVNDNKSQTNYQLTSSLNLFTGYYNYATWKAAQLNEKITNLTLERAKQQIKLDVTQAFLQVILDKKIVVLDSTNYAISLKREDQLATLVEVGRKAKTELYQQQAQTSNDKLTLINAKNKVLNDKILLLQKLRIETPELYDVAEIAIDDDANISKYGNETSLLNQALQDRVDLTAAQFNIQFSEMNITRFKSGYLPNVNLNLGLYNNTAYFNTLTVNGQNAEPTTQVAIPTQFYKYTYGQIGVNAFWNIFDRYATKTNVSISKIAAENARIDEQDTKINIVSSVKQAYNDYTNALQQMETVGAGLIAAQKAYEAVNGRYQEGVTDFITELNAQQALLQAQLNKIKASINLILQKSVIDYYVGNK